MTNYTKFAVRGAAAVFGISILAAFLGYLVRFLLARNLSVEEFGLFYSVISFLGFFVIIKSLGLDRSLVKFIPEFRHNNKNDLIKSFIIYDAFIQFVTNSIVIFAVYSLSGYLSAHFFHNSKADMVLKLMAIAFFIDNFVFILKFSFQGFKKMTLFAGVDLVRMFLILIVIFVGFRLNYGILSPIIAYIAAPAFLMIIFTPILLKKIFPEFFESKFVFDISLIKKLTSYGIHVISADFGWLVLGYTDVMVLTYFAGLTSVGLYNVALPAASLLTYFPRAVTGVIIPLSSELWVKKEKKLLKAGMELLYKYTAIVIIPVVFVLFSFTELLISVLFGSKYLPAGIAMKILSIGMIFAAFYMINASFFAGIGKPRINSTVVYAAAIFNLVFNLILIPLIGIIGAATTTSVSYFLMMLIGTIKIKRYVKIALPIKIWVKSIIAGLLFVISIELLKRVINFNVWIETTIVLVVAGIFYILALFLFKAVDVDEIKSLYDRVVK